MAEAEESLWYLGMLRDEGWRICRIAWPSSRPDRPEPIGQKRCWAAEDRCESWAEQRQAFGWAEGKLIQAVEQSPGHEQARSLLADMHWRRYRHARASQQARVGRRAPQGGPFTGPPIPASAGRWP
ncbi:MAG: hypothetical protein R3F43_26855 [bacterium]